MQNSLLIYFSKFESNNGLNGGALSISEGILYINSSTFWNNSAALGGAILVTISTQVAPSSLLLLSLLHFCWFLASNRVLYINFAPSFLLSCPSLLLPLLTLAHLFLGCFNWINTLENKGKDDVGLASTNTSLCSSFYSPLPPLLLPPPPSSSPLSRYF